MLCTLILLHSFQQAKNDTKDFYDPLKYPHHNCSAHQQFEANLVTWRLAVSEVELTNDDTTDGKIIGGHRLP